VSATSSQACVKDRTKRLTLDRADGWSKFGTALSGKLLSLLKVPRWLRIPVPPIASQARSDDRRRSSRTPSLFTRLARRALRGSRFLLQFLREEDQRLVKLDKMIAELSDGFVDFARSKEPQKTSP
jgi:hypothetical protein